MARLVILDMYRFCALLCTLYFVNLFTFTVYTVYSMYTAPCGPQTVYIRVTVLGVGCTLCRVLCTVHYIPVPSERVISTGFWRFFGFFSKMNMESPKVHCTGGCRENQALCVGQVSIELI